MIPPLGTRLPRILHLHYWGTVVHVRRSLPYIQLLAICALARVRASFAHLVGGTWACQRIMRLNPSWLSHSPNMNSDISIHPGALLLPLLIVVVRKVKVKLEKNMDTSCRHKANERVARQNPTTVALQYWHRRNIHC